MKLSLVSPLQFFLITMQIVGNVIKMQMHFNFCLKKKAFCGGQDCRTQGKQFCKIHCIILLVYNDNKEQWWIQSKRLLYFNLHLQYNNNDCFIVRRLLVTLCHLFAEKKIQFAQSLVVWGFISYNVCIWEAKAGERRKEVKKCDDKIMLSSD